MNRLNIILFAIFISLIELPAFGENVSKPIPKFDPLILYSVINSDSA